MSSINDFLRKINSVTRGVNNITRTVSSVNATIRAARTLRDQFRGKKDPRPSLPGSTTQPQRKPLSLTPVSKTTSGRNENKRPVRPAPKTDIGPKIR